jgi:3-hydroxyacyl-CoA dehydrogenase
MPPEGWTDSRPASSWWRRHRSGSNCKRELFARLSEICADDAILATNTSSILITSIATAAARSENVVGMHFFNPPPLMRLFELVSAAQTGERALSIAREVGEWVTSARRRGGVISCGGSAA